MSDAIIAAIVVAIGTVTAAAVSRPSRKVRKAITAVHEQLTPSNGTRVAEMVELTADRVEGIDERVTAHGAQLTRHIEQNFEFSGYVHHKFHGIEQALREAGIPFKNPEPGGAT